MPLLAKLGICELTIAALSGWAMVATVERPDALKRLGLRHLGRIRQAHLDLLFMGTILTAVGVAVASVPTWVGVLLILGAFGQPLRFLPLAAKATCTPRQITSLLRLRQRARFLKSKDSWGMYWPRTTPPPCATASPPAARTASSPPTRRRIRRSRSSATGTVP